MTPQSRESKAAFRRRVREVREREWIRDAVRARAFTGAETFEQGLDLIRFATGVAYGRKKRD